MESRAFEKDADSRPIPVYIAPTMDESDEISLADLWRVIARRKVIILASILFSVLLAFAYLFFAEPVYKANAHLLPPQQQKIQGLLINYKGIEEAIGVDRYTPESVYGAFLDNMKSQGMRREFFETHKLVKHYTSGKPTKDINADHVFRDSFNKRLDVQVDKQNDSFVTVSFSDNDPKFAAQRLNQFIDFVNQHTVQQLFSNVNAAIQSEIIQVRSLLDSKLNLAEQRRSDMILSLKEALRIATALGIKDTSTFPKMMDKTQAGLVVNTVELPLYMRGTDALETEIAVLESRKSDEPFITGFRDLQEKRDFLESLSIDPDKLSTVTVDSAAELPYRAEGPRKTQTILLGIVIGVITGLFMVFMTEFLSKMRRGVSEGSK